MHQTASNPVKPAVRQTQLHVFHVQWATPSTLMLFKTVNKISLAMTPSVAQSVLLDTFLPISNVSSATPTAKDANQLMSISAQVAKMVNSLSKLILLQPALTVLQVVLSVSAAQSVFNVLIISQQSMK